MRLWDCGSGRRYSRCGLSRCILRCRKGRRRECWGGRYSDRVSVGANYREAQRGRSKAEFVSKIGDCLKELDESQYWLELLTDSRIMPPTKLSKCATSAINSSLFLPRFPKRQNPVRRLDAGSYGQAGAGRMATVGFGVDLGLLRCWMRSKPRSILRASSRTSPAREFEPLVTMRYMVLPSRRIQ
jgi:hypothetical protein